MQKVEISKAFPLYLKNLSWMKFFQKKEQLFKLPQFRVISILLNPGFKTTIILLLLALKDVEREF